MGGHIIVAGKHMGKGYVCFDFAEALNRYKPESPLAVGAGKMVKAVFQIPDVVCSGLSKSAYPPSNQTK